MLRKTLQCAPEVKSEVFLRARERAGLELGPLEGCHPKLPEWERGEGRPTLRQVESFAKATQETKLLLQAVLRSF